MDKNGNMNNTELDVRKSYMIYRVMSFSGLFPYLRELVICMLEFSRRSGSKIDVKQIIDRIHDGLDRNDGFAVFIAFSVKNPDELIGYSLCKIEENNRERQCFIWQVYMKYPVRGILKEGYLLIKDWALRYNCGKVYFITRRDSKAYGRLLKTVDKRFFKKSVLFESDIKRSGDLYG